MTYSGSPNPDPGDIKANEDMLNRQREEKAEQDRIEEERRILEQEVPYWQREKDFEQNPPLDNLEFNLGIESKQFQGSQLVGSRFFDAVEGGVETGMDWLKQQAQDDPDRYTDDMLRLLGGGLQNTAWAISKLPLINEIAKGEDWLAEQARGMSEHLTPFLDPRFAGWGTRIATGILADKGIGKAVKGVKYLGANSLDDLSRFAVSQNPMYATGAGVLPPPSSVPRNKFHQLVMSLDQEGPYKLTPPGKFVSKTEDAVPEISKLQELTTQEIESLGAGFKTYMGKRPYKDAATPAGMERMQKEVNATFEQLLGPDFDQDLVRGYMKAVADHEGALTDLQVIMNDKTGKLWDKQHSKALRHLEHSGRMLGNKGLFPAFNFTDVLDQTPLGKAKKKIIREGNRPDRTARGSDFQRTLARALGKPLSLEESILYWYDQDMFYFWKELSPLQRQQLVDSSRTRSGGRIKSELTVAENINQALESMKFGQETMSGKLGRKLTPEERLQALVSQAQAALLKKRKYKGKNFKSSPRQGNVFYDIKTGIETDYRPDLTGKGAYWDIDSGP